MDKNIPTVAQEFFGHDISNEQPEAALVDCRVCTHTVKEQASYA
jgi:hypothetical protein